MCKILSKDIPNYELVLVGNYAVETDKTPHIVEEIATRNPRIRYSALKKEGMMGWDMKTGLGLATGEYIAIIDGDGQMPFEDVSRVYKAMRAHDADMGKTYRTIRGDDLWRTCVSYVYNGLFRILFPGYRIRDVNSKPKIFSRRALDKLTLVSDDWFIDAEMVIQARRYNFILVEVPTVFNKLVGRQSFVKANTIFEFLKNLAVFRIKEFNVKRET